MGKKKDKAAAAAAAAAAGGAPAPGGKAPPLAWAAIDADPVGFLVAPMVRTRRGPRVRGARRARRRAPPRPAARPPQRTAARRLRRATPPPPSPPPHLPPLPLNQTSATFFSECWERAPRVFKATPERAALAARLTTLPSLLAWLREEEAACDGESPLAFGRDVNAARYRDGVRQTPSEGLGEAGSADLKALHDDDGCTLQARRPGAAAARARCGQRVTSQRVVSCLCARRGARRPRQSFWQLPGRSPRRARPHLRPPPPPPPRCTSPSGGTTPRGGCWRRSRRSWGCWWALTHTSRRLAARASRPTTTVRRPRGGARPAARPGRGQGPGAASSTAPPSPQRAEP
jgi:hypothetical protein